MGKLVLLYIVSLTVAENFWQQKWGLTVQEMTYTQILFYAVPGGYLGKVLSNWLMFKSGINNLNFVIKKLTRPFVTFYLVIHLFQNTGVYLKNCGLFVCLSFTLLKLKMWSRNQVFKKGKN